MFAEHAFTKGSELLPFVTAILTSRIGISISIITIYVRTYDKLLVANGHRKVAIERHTEVVRVVALRRDDVF